VSWEKIYDGWYNYVGVNPSTSLESMMWCGGTRRGWISEEMGSFIHSPSPPQ
jgi:hypothetical protein